MAYNSNTGSLGALFLYCTVQEPHKTKCHN